MKKKFLSGNAYVINKNKILDNENLNYVVKSKSKRGKNFYVYLFLFFIIVFVGSMFSLRNICLINKKSREIIILQEELKLCKSENIALENEISRRFDLEFVEKFAREKLGMHEPFAWQIVKIKEPKVNYLIKYDKKS